MHTRKVSVCMMYPGSNNGRAAVVPKTVSLLELGSVMADVFVELFIVGVGEQGLCCPACNDDHLWPIS